MIRRLAFAVSLAAALLASGAVQAKNLIEVAQEAGTFTILLAAVKSTGLTETLMAPGPITIFAPTDDAFAKLPKETLQGLMKPENRETLKSIVIHHLVDGKAVSRDFLGKRLEAATMDGQALLIDATKGVMIENAKLIKADIAADNGYIHVIDTVIIPR